MIISENIAELVTALAKAQGAIENASKGAVNPHFKSSYATLADIREAIREPLAENGLSIVQGLRTVNGGIEVETVLFHASGQSIRETLAMQAGRGTPQDIGSASSYARRYGVMAMLGLAAEDDDGNAASTSANGSKTAPGITGPAPGVAGPISHEQLIDLLEFIEIHDAEPSKILTRMNVTRLEDIPAAGFTQLMTSLAAWAEHQKKPSP